MICTCRYFTALHMNSPAYQWIVIFHTISVSTVKNPANKSAMKGKVNMTYLMAYLMTQLKPTCQEYMDKSVWAQYF